MNRKIIYSFVLLSLFCMPFSVYAEKLENPLKGIETFPALLEKIAEVVGAVVGTLAVLMLIISGIYFLLSAGNPNLLSKAKASLTYAIIGGAVALAATGLVALLEQVIGVSS